MLLAEPSYLDEIAQLHQQAFSDAEETLEASRRYITEALKDSDGLLYILLKEAQVIGVCTVDLSGNNNYLYGLAVAEAYRGQGYGSYLAKSLVNQLIEQNDKEFQIAVEDSNVGAKRLYEKIGFVKQTQVVYLKQKNDYMLLEEFENVPAVIEPTDRSLLSGGEICDTIILSFNGEILERVKQIDGVYEGGYLTNLNGNFHGISMK